MSEQTCTKCSITKPLSEFMFRTDRNKYSAACRKCRNARDRDRKARAKKDPSTHQYGKKDLPPGYSLKGVSQLVDAQGNVRQQWLKSTKDDSDRIQEYMEAIRDMCEPYRASIEPTPPPSNCSEADLINVVPLGDMHIGLHCWADEVGENFDLKIAERNTHTAIDNLLAVAPPAKTAMIINVGDYLHADSSRNTTTKGTPVDVDGRYPKVTRVALDIFRYTIRAALRTHEFVHVKSVGGNHDVEASSWLRAALDMIFENEPRVHVDTSPAKHHYLRFGKVFFGITHGDSGKIADLPILMADDRPEDWSASVFRHWYTGHIHHDVVKELRGATVESVRVLAPADAWHRAQGYKSLRDLKCDTWHKEYGLWQRNVIGIRRIMALQAEGREQ